MYMYLSTVYSVQGAIHAYSIYTESVHYSVYTVGAGTIYGVRAEEVEAERNNTIIYVHRYYLLLYVYCLLGTSLVYYVHRI